MRYNLALDLFTLGRVLLGGIYVFAGLRHFLHIKARTDQVAARGMPYPRVVLVIGAVWQTVAGTLLALGIWAAPAAFALIAFTVVASVMLLNFWDREGPQREGQFNAIVQNIGLCGGLLAIAALSL